LGNDDVETIGQYAQRKQQLAELADRAGAPIGHYRWLVVDRGEAMQQSPYEIERAAAEALQSGFTVFAEKEDIIVYRHP
jgi:hypothetical protein